MDAEHIKKLALELGFELGGWDDTYGGVFADQGQSDCVGTHAEVWAFLRGWALNQSRSPRTVRRQLLSLRSDGPYTNGRRDNVLVPGSTFQVISRPQRGGIRGERIAIPDSIARYFELIDLTVANRSVMPQAQRISGELLAVRIDQKAKFAFDHRPDHPVTLMMTEPALAEFGLEIEMDPCPVAADVVATAYLKAHAPPVEFELLIVGSMSNHEYQAEHQDMSLDATLRRIRHVMGDSGRRTGYVGRTLADNPNVSRQLTPEEVELIRSWQDIVGR